MAHSLTHPWQAKDLTYSFDSRMRASLPPTFKPGIQRAFLALFVLSLFWLGCEHIFQIRAQKKFIFEKVALQQEIKTRLDEKDHIYRIIASFETGLAENLEQQLAALIIDLADQYKMDPYLILGVIRVESYFYTRAVSVAGAEGLMQVLPVVGEEVAGELGIPYHYGTSLFNPMINVQIGTHYLSQLLMTFKGDLELALIAYNRGPNGLKRALNGGEGIATEYADQVLIQYQRYLREREALVRNEI